MLVEELRHSCLTPSDVLLPLFHLKTGRKNAVEIKPWNRHGPIGTKLCSYPWWGFPSDAWRSAWLPGRGSENAFVGDKKKKEEKNLLFYFEEIWVSAANGGKGKAIFEANTVQAEDPPFVWGSSPGPNHVSGPYNNPL